MIDVTTLDVLVGGHIDAHGKLSPDHVAVVHTPFISLMKAKARWWEWFVLPYLWWRFSKARSFRRVPSIRVDF